MSNIINKQSTNSSKEVINTKGDLLCTYVNSSHQCLGFLNEGQYFCIPSEYVLYKVLFEKNEKVYVEVLTDGKYKGCAFAFPDFLSVDVYEIKH